MQHPSLYVFLIRKTSSKFHYCSDKSNILHVPAWLMHPSPSCCLYACGRQTDRFMNRANLRTCLRFQWIHVTPLSLRADPVCLRSTVLAPHEWNGAALAPGPSWLLCPKSALACRWDLLMEIKGLSSPYTPTQTHT